MRIARARDPIDLNQVSVSDWLRWCPIGCTWERSSSGGDTTLRLTPASWRRGCSTLPRRSWRTAARTWRSDAQTDPTTCSPGFWSARSAESGSSGRRLRETRTGTRTTCVSRGTATGPQECDQDRLRADELEDRVVESLLAALARRDLLEDAVDRWGEIVETTRPSRERELAAVEAQIRKAPGIVGSLIPCRRRGEAPGGGLHPTNRGALGGAHVARGPAI
jgi:hypothetical protein